MIVKIKAATWQLRIVKVTLCLMTNFFMRMWIQDCTFRCLSTCVIICDPGISSRAFVGSLFATDNYGQIEKSEVNDGLHLVM